MSFPVSPSSVTLSNNLLVVDGLFLFHDIRCKYIVDSNGSIQADDRRTLPKSVGEKVGERQAGPQ